MDWVRTESGASPAETGNMRKPASGLSLDESWALLKNKEISQVSISRGRKENLAFFLFPWENFSGTNSKYFLRRNWFESPRVISCWFLIQLLDCQLEPRSPP